MTEVERVDWSEFAAGFAWKQGEHCSLIGTTGGGKTVLANAIMPKRRYAVVFGTKPADPSLDALIASGWTRIKRWEDRPFLSAGRGKPEPMRLVLWPDFDSMAAIRDLQSEFRKALEAMFTERNWSVFCDEVSFIARDLGLDAHVKLWLRQGRSIGLSLVSATQRPAWIPVECYSEASHLFLWRSTDRRDLKRLTDIAGPVDARTIQDTVQSLDFHRHEVLYVEARTGRLVVTVPPAPGGMR